jgi:hypothetical protein
MELQRRLTGIYIANIDLENRRNGKQFFKAIFADHSTCYLFYVYSPLGVINKRYVAPFWPQNYYVKAYKVWCLEPGLSLLISGSLRTVLYAQKENNTKIIRAIVVLDMNSGFGTTILNQSYRL